MRTKIFVIAVAFLGMAGFFSAFKASADSVTVLTPTASQNWASGSSATIQWDIATSTATNVNLALIPYSSSSCSTTSTSTTCMSASPYVIATNVSNTGSYNGNVNITTDMNGRAIPAGQYLLRVYDTSNSGNTLNTLGNSAQIITIGGAMTPGIILLSPNSGPVGTVVTITGVGFSTSSTSSVLFGSGNYLLPMSTSSDGSSYQITIPYYTQPCSSASSPAMGNMYASNTLATTACGIASAMVTPGVYTISVTGNNGNTYSLPFTVTSTSTPSAGQTGFTEGSLVQISGNPTVYLVSNNMFMPFSSAQVFMAKGYNWSQVQVIPATQFNSQYISTTPVLLPNAALVKADNDPTIYVIASGQKNGIPSMDVFNRLGFNLSNVVVLTSPELQAYPTGPLQS